MVTLSLGMIPFASSCSDDDTADEWSATYVYLQRSDYLIKGDKVFSLKHSSAGVSGDEINMAFTVKTQKPAPQDIVVDIVGKTSNETFQPYLALSSSQITIKAGQTSSEEITATIPDLSFLEEIEDKLSYNFNISIANIQTNSGNTVISNLQNDLKVIVNKSAFANLAKGEPENSKLIENRSVWNITIEDGVENGPGNLIDGRTGTDVARNNEGFWISIDLGENKDLTGIKTNSWGSAYAPSEVEVYYSKDNSTWKSLGTLKVSGGVQYITFVAPVNARYLKYDIVGISSNGRTDITEFNIYEKDTK